MVGTNDAQIPTQRFVESTAMRLASQLSDWDYEIINERELCHLFFAAMVGQCADFGIAVRHLKAEVRLYGGGSVDLGVASWNALARFSVLVEAKAWIRPLDASPWSKRNQATSKRNQCVVDAKRLAKLLTTGTCHSAALLILERNSTHLRRRTGDELEKSGLRYHHSWVDIRRESTGQHKEHLGIIWIDADGDQRRDVTRACTRPPQKARRRVMPESLGEQIGG